MAIRQLALSIAIASLGAAPAFADTTLPTGGQVAAGSASIGSSGAAMTINQASQRAIIHWNSFSIGSDASVTFNQPNSSAIALNRVLGNDLSRIDGQLNANGQVFITNPNGVLFGSGSQVNVGGLVASTLDMDEAAFMGGNFVLQGNSTESVTNEGSLNGQNIALVGARVINTGTITADSAVLAAGERVTLQFDGDGLITASVDAKALNGYIENGGIVSVGEGRLLMTAGTASELTSTVINNTGILQANSLTNQGGEIVLGGDYLVNTGAIEASGQSGGNITLNADRTLMAGTLSAEGTGQGGTITTDTRRHRETQASSQSVNGDTAGTIQLTAQLDLFSSGTYTADGDAGGNIDITAQNIELRGATVSATGAGDGGHIRIGGGYQGQDADIQNATTNTIANTTINASSTDNGNGGTVIVWSDQQTDFYGTAKATGGINAGDGGFIEVSGKELLNFGGTGDASAANGKAGSLLLDPKDLVVDSVSSVSSILKYELIDPSSWSGDKHGSGGQLALENGNIVVFSPEDGSDRGGVFLYSPDGSLISLLTGELSGDKIGDGGVHLLSNGNFVVLSLLGYGAATWVDADVGVSGIVSQANSLVGTNLYDFTFAKVFALTNGNYVVVSPKFDDPGIGADYGAVTWADGNVGLSGYISELNSLVGDGSNSFSGGQIISLSNGNYVLHAPQWQSAVGAAMWLDGSVALSGTFDPTKALVGGSVNDGGVSSSVTALANGNYVVAFPSWDNGAMANVGAVVWGDGSVGVSGIITSENALVGSQANDYVGTSVTPLANGNYVVRSPSWDAVGVANVGAVTLGDGFAGLSGIVSSANSLTGSSIDDKVGSFVTALPDGDYVVISGYWDDGLNADVGAVTWQNGNTQLAGQVSTSNSLFGAQANDLFGASIQILSDGNYLVVSPAKNGALKAGSISYCESGFSCSGQIGETTSLIGLAGMQLGVNGVHELANGNFVVASDGVISWVDGVSGFSGVANSTMATAGQVVPLADGNYVINDPEWGSGRGAVTWMDGFSGAPDTVRPENSYMGANPDAFLSVRSYSCLFGGCSYRDLSVLIPGDGFRQQVYALDDGSYLVYRPSEAVYTRKIDASGCSSGFRPACAQGEEFEVLLKGALSIGKRLSSGSLLEELIYTDSTFGDSYAAVRDVRWVYGSGLAQGGLFVPHGLFYLDDQRYVLQNNRWQAGAFEPHGGVFVFDVASRQVTHSAMHVESLLSSGSNLVIKADNDITFNTPVIVDNPSGNGGSLTLQAGRNINFNANIVTDNGNLTAIAGDPSANPAYRDAGTPTITIASGVNLDVGEGVLTLAAIGGNFVNNSGAGALTTSGAGYWHIYSSHPDNNTFGGLASGNQALWNMVYGDAVSAGGNRYIFEYQPTLDFTTIDGVKKGIRAKNINNLYAANGFVDASLYGNVFTQDTKANSLSGAPNLYSQGAEAWQKAGSYPITFQGWGTLASSNGYALGGFTDGSNLAVQLSFMDKLRLTIHNILLKFRRR